MKKQWATIFLSAFLALPMLSGVSVAAASQTNLSNSVTGIIPEERLLPRLVDQADLLSEEEEAEVLSSLNEISERQECDVVIITVNSLEGKTAKEYADDVYDYNGYGFGEERDGILLLISMESRNWAISTCGEGIIIFTDAGQEYIVEKFKPLLSNAEYKDAFLKYAELSDQFIIQARTGEPYDVGNMPKGSVSSFWIFGDFVIGCLIALGIGNRKKKRLKTVQKKTEAQDYAVSESLMLSKSWDRMINRRVTSRTISKSSDSDRRGGSSTHTSSSGTTHGGSSGKF